MLISLRRRFIFVANLKTASTSIEEALSQYCEISIRDAEFGKHKDFAQIERDFRWIFEIIPREGFFVFGVIRDPLDYALSLYRSHTKDDFRDSPLYTGGIDFAQFVDDWLVEYQDQWREQWTRFTNSGGCFDLDFLMRYQNLAADWAQLCDMLQLPSILLDTYNESPLGIREADVSPDLSRRIRGERSRDLMWLTEWGGKVRRRPWGAC